MMATVMRSEHPDHDEHEECPNKNALHALLEKRSDLNLAGMNGLQARYICYEVHVLK